MASFWTVSRWEIAASLTPLEAEDRLRAALKPGPARRHALSGAVSNGRIVASVKPFDMRADLHPRLVVDISPRADGARLICRIAPRYGGLVFSLLSLVFLALVALFCLATSIDPQLNARARDPYAAFVIFSVAAVGGACHFALLLYLARNDRALLADFVRRALAAAD